MTKYLIEDKLTQDTKLGITIFIHVWLPTVVFVATDLQLWFSALVSVFRRTHCWFEDFDERTE